MTVQRFFQQHSEQVILVEEEEGDCCGLVSWNTSTYRAGSSHLSVAETVELLCFPARR